MARQHLRRGRMRSALAECNEWIDAGSSPCWDPRGERGTYQQHKDNDAKAHEIEALYRVKRAVHQPANRDRAGSTDHDAADGKETASPDNQEGHLRSLRTKRHAQTNLLSPLRD